MLNLADTGRNNVVAVIGEFVGTFLFLFWSFAGTQISNTPMPAEGSYPNTSNLLYASLAFGFSLTVNVWAFYRVTGGLFNPSVCHRPYLNASRIFVVMGYLYLIRRMQSTTTNLSRSLWLFSSLEVFLECAVSLWS